jgi:hypothetical protein
MRAATWPDWVRGKRDFDHSTCHYVNYPIVPPGSAVKASDHEPPAKQENIVNQLAVCLEKIRTRSDVEKAIYMAWLFHVAGHIHQPLHCTAVFSEQFPNGDLKAVASSGRRIAGDANVSTAHRRSAAVASLHGYTSGQDDPATGYCRCAAAGANCRTIARIHVSQGEPIKRHFSLMAWGGTRSVSSM